MILAIGILVALLAIVAFGLYARSDADKKDRLLHDNGYFLGRQIDEVVASMGIAVKKYPRWTGHIDYVWGFGDSSVLLICDDKNEIVDYCPARQPPEAVLSYFEKNQDSLAEVDLWDIKKNVGESHNFNTFDFGVAVDIWKISKQKVVEVWTKNGFCTEVVIK